MPLKSKYEIRSPEVQEVLSTPPRFLIFWGNTLVIVLLLVGILFLNRYKIIQKTNVPAQIIETNGTLAVIVDSAFSGQIKANQKVKLKTKDNTVITEGSIKAMIDTTINKNRMTYITLTDYSSNNLLHESTLNDLINSVAEIQIGEESLLHLFVSKILRSHY
jgi:uncharacterized membrane protein YcaP (DUF421 family)